MNKISGTLEPTVFSSDVIEGSESMCWYCESKAGHVAQSSKSVRLWIRLIRIWLKTLLVLLSHFVATVDIDYKTSQVSLYSYYNILVSQGKIPNIEIQIRCVEKNLAEL